jgi:dihydrolipoamide dehydrogenase
MMRSVQVDVAIIGAGTAGLSAYRAVRAQGKPAVLIEDGPYGTTCARVGCMPSKLLIAAAEAAHTLRHSAAFGVHVNGSVRIDGRQVMQRVRSERDRFVGFVLESVEAIPDTDKLRGHARFLSDTQLQVDDHTVVEASRVIIATGSSPVVPELYAGLGDRLVVNDDVFEWEDLPQSVLVVGAGVIGLELGQALARLGVRVTIVNRTDRFAGIADPLVKASALRAFQEELDVRLATDVVKVDSTANGVNVVLQTAGQAAVALEVQYVLLAAGRHPNVADLDLHRTSIPLAENGMPVFDRDTLQVAGVPVFIAGDANAAWPLLHEAADDGRFAGENAARYPAVTAWQRRAPMAVVFTDPQVARVGLAFNQLPSGRVAMGEVSFQNQGRSRVMLKNKGALRVYAHVPDGRLLGAEMAGPAMEHIAHLLAWSLQQGLTIAQMLEMPFYHPVVEEGLRTALRDAARNLAVAQLNCVECDKAAVNSA